MVSFHIPQDFRHCVWPSETNIIINNCIIGCICNVNQLGCHISCNASVTKPPKPICDKHMCTQILLYRQTLPVPTRSCYSETCVWYC